MKTLNKTLMVVSLSLFAVAPAFASHGDDRPVKQNNFEQQLERQQHRIDQGVKQHQLTRKEAKLLRSRQREIRHLAHRFYKDGYLSKRERLVLNRELSDSSRLIKRLKHNDLERYVNLHQRYGYRDHAHRL
jgi:septal ring factor EnvC (AmiA/AmiB activator)